MFGKEFLLIRKSMKKTIFYILKIFIKIGNAWERTIIYQKKYKKDNIIQLENINKKIGNVWERTLINHKRYIKDNNFHLGNINQNWECLGKNFYLSLKN